MKECLENQNYLKSVKKTDNLQSKVAANELDLNAFYDSGLKLSRNGFQKGQDLKKKSIYTTLT